MTDQQLIEKIAEILFKDRKLNVWQVCNTLEDLFKKERPQMKIKYDKVFWEQEIRERQEKIDELKEEIEKLEKGMQLIKEKY